MREILDIVLEILKLKVANLVSVAFFFIWLAFIIQADGGLSAYKK